MPRHDRDAGGRPEDLAAKAALRDEVWSAMTAAHVARFPGAAGRIPNFTGAEAAAELLRARPEWDRARAIKSNPDSAQLPVRQRALQDGKTVYMAVPRLAEEDPFFLLDPAHLSDPPRKAASIKGASRSARRIPVADLAEVGLVVSGCVAVGEDGARLGKGGGFADLEYALASAAGLIGPDTLVVTTVHELQVRPGGRDPGHRARRPGRPGHHPGAGHRLPAGTAAAGTGFDPVGRADRGQDRGHPAAGQTQATLIRPR